MAINDFSKNEKINLPSMVTLYEVFVSLDIAATLGIGNKSPPRILDS